MAHCKTLTPGAEEHPLHAAPQDLPPPGGCAGRLQGGQGRECGGHSAMEREAQGGEGGAGGQEEGR